MEHVRIQTAQNVAIDVEVAGLGDRILAALIDYALIGCYALGAQIVTLILFDGVGTFFLLLYLPAFLYFLLCEVFMDGQSIGKRLRAIRVARLDGSEATLGGYLIRWLLRPVDVLMTSGLAAMLCIFATGTGQRLGDLAAGTAVLKARPRTRLRDTLYTPTGDAHTLTFPQAEHLTGEDIATAKAVLDTLITDGRTPTTYRLALDLKGALAQKMGATSDRAPVDFLRTVVADYNHLRGRA